MARLAANILLMLAIFVSSFASVSAAAQGGTYYFRFGTGLISNSASEVPVSDYDADITARFVGVVGFELSEKIPLIPGVEGAPVSSGKSDPARVGANRVSYRAVAPKEGVVVGFMHDGRIVAGETDAYGRIGAYIEGASDLPATLVGIDESNGQSHILRLLSALAVAALAGGALFRDFSTVQVVEKPLKFGR